MMRFVVTLIAKQRYRGILVQKKEFRINCIAPEVEHITIQEGDNDSFVFVSTCCTNCMFSPLHLEVPFSSVEDIAPGYGCKKTYEIVLHDKTHIYLVPED